MKDESMERQLNRVEIERLKHKVERLEDEINYWRSLHSQEARGATHWQAEFRALEYRYKDREHEQKLDAATTTVTESEV